MNDVVLCSGTLREADFETTARSAAVAGFQGISLYFDEYIAAQRAGWSDADMCALLDSLGLRVAELDGKMSWLPSDDGGASATEFVNAAGALHARSITVLETEGGRLGAELPFEAVVPAFIAVCERAAEHGLLVHIEYFPLSGIDRFSLAYEVVRRAEQPNGGILVDVWHHLRGPDRGRTDFGDAASAVLGLQLSDVALQPSSPDLRTEMMTGRLLPGDGTGDIAGIVRALRANGCVAPLEAEIYSSVLAAMDPFEAARLAASAVHSVLDCKPTDDGVNPQR